MKRVPFPELARMRMILAWVFVASLFCFTAGSCIVNADSSVLPTIYEFEEKDHYDITDLDAVAHASAVGKLTISNASAIQTGGFPTYDIKGDESSITYSFSKDRISAGADGWTIIEDKSKEVNSEKLDHNIMNGAIVVQTSVDGNKWITDKTMTDVFAGNDKNLVVFEPNEVQMSNGCYLRILVVYKEQTKVKDGKLLHFFDKPEYEYRKRAEVYEFHLTNSSMDRAGTESPEEEPRKEYHDFYEIKKKHGAAYSLSKKIDKAEFDEKHPHLSWELGHFVVNGYSGLIENDDGDVYLKTPGDKVTLWFKLVQDIDQLNNKDNLSISDDTSRVDSDFNIESNNFRHGALIVKHTNSQGAPKVNVYTDFLLANTKTGADTKLVINEEGTYEVALDYEIKDSKGIDSYTGYKLICKFSVRNGSGMFYLFDAKTNSELSDKSYTKNGFRIDLAQSKSLDIKVDQYNVWETSSGIDKDLRKKGVKAEDVVYSEEGIYVLTVTNRYTNESTPKTIYVGDNQLIENLWFNKISIPDLEELNIKLNDGWYFDEETHKLQRKQETIQELPPVSPVTELPLEQPVESVELPQPEVQTQPAVAPSENVPTVVDSPEAMSQPVLAPAEPVMTQSLSPVIVWGSIAVAGGGGALLIAHRRKSKKYIGSAEKPIEVENYAISDSKEAEEE